jgi:hypothetical protein
MQGRVWLAQSIERGGRAVRLGIGAEDRNPGQDFIGQAGHRIDPRESVVDVKVRRLARGILGDDLSDVETCARGQGELRRNVKGVESVDAIISCGAGDEGWHVAYSFHRGDDRARSRKGSVADDQIGEDGAKLAGGAVACTAVPKVVAWMEVRSMVP